MSNAKFDISKWLYKNFIANLPQSFKMLITPSAKRKSNNKSSFSRVDLIFQGWLDSTMKPLILNEQISILTDHQEDIWS